MVPGRPCNCDVVADLIGFEGGGLRRLLGGHRGRRYDGVTEAPGC